MGFINWDVTGFLMPLLVKENIVNIHPNNFPTVIYQRRKSKEKTLVQGVKSIQSSKLKIMNRNINIVG